MKQRPHSWNGQEKLCWGEQTGSRKVWELIQGIKFLTWPLCTWRECVVQSAGGWELGAEEDRKLGLGAGSVDSHLYTDSPHLPQASLLIA